MILLNRKEIIFTKFPNGETLMDTKSIQETINKKEFFIFNEIRFKFENNEDLFNLMLLKKYLDTQCIDTTLHLLYMPYSRMDRSENGSAFTLKYVCDFINSLNFYNVIVLEPHSDVTPALINNVTSVYMSHDLAVKAMKDNGFDLSKDYVFFPDAGAQKRYDKLMKLQNTLVGYKNRDFDSGKITSFKVVGDIPEHPFKVVIVDDLSSFGNTFRLSAEALREIGATEVYLCVTHAEDSILKGGLLESGFINKVYTTNSILTGSHERLDVEDIIYKE